MKRRIVALLVAFAWLAAGCGLQGAPPTTEAPQAQGEVVQQEQVVSIPLSGTPGAVEVIGGDEASLRELLARALHYAYPEGGDTFIYVGGLPPDLPVEMPFPEGTRVIGTVDRGRKMGTELFLDADMSPEEAIAFYQEELGALGWVSPEDAYPQTGFVSESFPSLSLCEGGGEAFLWVSASESSQGTTDIRLNLQAAPEYSPCKAGYGPGYEDRIQGLLPALTSPAGATVRSGGSSSGADEADISASIRTGLSAADLADHYHGQILENGWIEVKRASGEGAAWSFWEREVDGEKWVGTLLVLESPAVEDQIFAWFRIELVPEDE
ncbi:MAG: hypothetical protein ACRDG5_09495 [Anaerolineales bacterium]